MGQGRWAIGVTVIASEGSAVPGPLPGIGNTTSRVGFGCDPGEWTDARPASGAAHHRALGTGHRVAELDLIDLGLTVVRP